jgi:hypothetical protein
VQPTEGIGMNNFCLLVFFSLSFTSIRNTVAAFCRSSDGSIFIYTYDRVYQQLAAVYFLLSTTKTKIVHAYSFSRLHHLTQKSGYIVDSGFVLNTITLTLTQTFGYETFD